MGNKKKMTILDFKKYKEEGRKFSFVTAYDYTTATIVDESDNEIILVGDSLGMIMLGYDSTVPVTMEDMIHHIKPVVKGAPNTFIIGDMPFGSYNESIEQAIHNATRLTKETNCDCVKLEGGASADLLLRGSQGQGDRQDVCVCQHPHRPRERRGAGEGDAARDRADEGVFRRCASRVRRRPQLP